MYHSRFWNWSIWISARTCWETVNTNTIVKVTARTGGGHTCDGHGIHSTRTHWQTQHVEISSCCRQTKNVCPCHTAAVMSVGKASLALPQMIHRGWIVLFTTAAVAFACWPVGLCNSSAAVSSISPRCLRLYMMREITTAAPSQRQRLRSPPSLLSRFSPMSLCVDVFSSFFFFFWCLRLRLCLIAGVDLEFCPTSGATIVSSSSSPSNASFSQQSPSLSAAASPISNGSGMIVG